MEQKKNIYESGDATLEERERLRKLGYPFLVSRELIGEEVRGKTILDVGSGSNTALQEWIAMQGGRYVAFDISRQYLEDQKAKGAPAAQGSADRLPFKPDSVDITHARFLLMHLPGLRRKDAIQDIVGAAKERALFLEFDWTPFAGSPAVNRLRDFALKFLLPRSDPYLGSKLKDQIVRAVPNAESFVSEHRNSREAGLYYDELQRLIASLKSIIERVEPGLLDEANEIEKTIQDEATKETPEPFVPPDIVAVEVRRNGAPAADL